LESDFETLLVMARKGRQWTFAFTIKWSKFLRPEIVDKEEDVWQALWRSALAEFFGTLIFTFCGMAVVTSAQLVSPPTGAFGAGGLILVAFGHGFAISFVIYAIGEISGGHINPAVTWATLLTGRLSVLRFFLYIFCQIVGAICGGGIARALLPDYWVNFFNLGCHNVNRAIYSTPWKGFGAEVIFTFIFVFVVFATAVSPFAGKLAPLSGGGQDYGPGKLTPLALGLCILCLHLVGVPITGASMNPARSFGAAVARHDAFCFDYHWIYWAGPLLGATGAAFVATAVFLGNPNSVKTVLLLSRGRDKFNKLLIPETDTSYNAAVVGDSAASIQQVKQAEYSSPQVTQLPA